MWRLLGLILAVGLLTGCGESSVVGMVATPTAISTGTPTVTPTATPTLEVEPRGVGWILPVMPPPELIAGRLPMKQGESTSEPAPIVTMTPAWCQPSEILADASTFTDDPLGSARPDAVNLIPMEAHEWHEETNKNYPCLPIATFANGVMTIMAPPPPQDSYPAKSWWAVNAPTITDGRAYTMRADIRVSGSAKANILIGVNVNRGDGHWFQHWHANANEIIIGNPNVYYGDWSERNCVSTVPIDGNWHTVELAWDGADMLSYRLDGEIVCSQIREHPFTLTATDQANFRIYVERYPDLGGPTYVVQVRNFIVK
jgi:hypothetical protein